MVVDLSCFTHEEIWQRYPDLPYNDGLKEIKEVADNVPKLRRLIPIAVSLTSFFIAKSLGSEDKDSINLSVALFPLSYMISVLFDSYRVRRATLPVIDNLSKSNNSKADAFYDLKRTQMAKYAEMGITLNSKGSECTKLSGLEKLAQDFNLRRNKTGFKDEVVELKIEYCADRTGARIEIYAKSFQKAKRVYAALGALMSAKQDEDFGRISY